MSPDLATAEAWLREVAGHADPDSTSQHAFTRTGVALHVLLRDLDRLRALRQQLWEMCGRPDGFGLDAELIDAVGDLRYPAGAAGLGRPRSMMIPVLTRALLRALDEVQIDGADADLGEVMRVKAELEETLKVEDLR